MDTAGDIDGKPDFPVAGEDLPPVGTDPLPDEPVKERELTAMEMMGAPMPFARGAFLVGKRSPLRLT